MPDIITNPNTAPSKADLTIRADGSLDLTTFVGEVLPSADAVLLSLGGDLKEYSKLRRDDQVKALLQQRQDKLVETEWEVQPGGEGAKDKAAADFLREQLSGISFDGASKRMHGGILYGYSVGECLWGRDGRHITLADIKVRKPWRFGFGKDLALKLRVGTQWQTMPPRKFWLCAWDAEDDDSPYGTGLGHALWWPVYLKRNGARFWAAFLDRFGVPTTKATYPADGSEAELEKRKRKALEAALSLRSEGAIAMPVGFDVQLVEAASKGAGDFGAFLAYWDDAIAKIILSQTGTSRIGQYSGTADVHASVGYSVIKADADTLCESFNAGPARWLTEWNFPGALPPKVWRKVEDPARLTAEQQRDKGTRELGLRLTDAEIERRYGETWEREGNGVTASGKGPGADADFAEDSLGPAGGAVAPDSPQARRRNRTSADMNAPEGGYDRELAGQLAALADAPTTMMLDQIKAELDKAVQRGEDMATFAERMLGMGKLQGVDDLAALMGGALMASNLAGRAGED